MNLDNVVLYFTATIGIVAYWFLIQLRKNLMDFEIKTRSELSKLQDELLKLQIDVMALQAFTAPSPKKSSRNMKKSDVEEKKSRP